MTSKYIICDLLKSPREGKRFRINYTDDGKKKHVDFGSDVGTTYVDTGNEKLRENYRKRHTANATERNRIENLIPSPATFSYWILWGDEPDIFDNLIELQKMFNKYYPA